MTDNENILVSISCMTFNHELYIRKAIEGFLMQKTNFAYEVLIHDDASTDRTCEIIHEYELKYPRLIKAIYQTENKYCRKDGSIFKVQLGRVKSKYIAICEGDDYWTDPYKLQKQVDFLEKNPDYSLCFTDSTVVDSKGAIIKDKRVPNNIKKKKLTYIDLIYYSPPTQTVIFRKNNHLLEVLSKLPYYCDHILFYLASNQSKVKYSDEITAAYRLHHSGVYSSLSYIEQIENYNLKNLKILETLINQDDIYARRSLKYAFALQYSKLFLHAYDNKDKTLLVSSFKKMLSYDESFTLCVTRRAIFNLLKYILKRSLS